jgi:acyl-CoA thioesterase-1
MLKFCYLLAIAILLSCGGEPKKVKEVDHSPQESELPQQQPIRPSSTILFFGNSLTAGMGLDPDKSFPALIQERIDSLGLGYTVINAGLSGETTASGESRIDWLLNQKIAIFILELGANDGLRGIPLSETRENLQAIIDAVKNKNPETLIILAGMQIPPNMGPEYTSEFSAIFPDLAEKNKAYLIPFLLEDVAGVPELNQADGIHPTEDGQKIVADNVWEILGPLVQR